MEENKYISIKGARVNNLKNVSVDIPRNKLVVINKAPTSRDKYANLCISGSIGEVLGSLKI